MKETIIILGAGIMQGPAIKIAKELGLYTIALDGSTKAPCISMADRFEHIDLKDKEAIETYARSLQSKTSRLGIMTAGTDFSASVAWVAEKLGLPGIPYEAALNASDKSRMRECFKKAGLPSPEFVTITEKDIDKLDVSTPLNAVQDFSALSPIPYPLVIKPVDNMGSRGCRRVDTIEEFAQAAKDALNYSRCGRAIVESYMDGPEFSVDAIVDNEEITICGLADRHIFFPPYFIEMGHTMPTVIEEEKQRAILETFCAGIRCLGIAGTSGAASRGKENAGAAKGDIKLTAKGPMIGEIAARLSGGYMSGWTYPYSSGASPIKAAILIAMGKRPEGLIPVKKWTCAERAFISIPGTVKEITGDEKAKAIPNVSDLFLRIREGDKVSFPENNVTKCGNILASAPEREKAISAAENAVRSILIKLDPSDNGTAEFLNLNFLTETQSQKEEKFVFPPDAFDLTEEIKKALYLLPETLCPANLCFDVSARDNINLCPFLEFTESTLTDYMGRTVEESLQAVRSLTGLPLQIASKNADNVPILGRSFWAALIRGGYQGAVYYIDSICH